MGNDGDLFLWQGAAIGFLKLFEDGGEQFLLGRFGRFGFGRDGAFFRMLLVILLKGLGFEGFPLDGHVFEHLDDDEQSKGNDQEGDDGVYEGAPIDDGSPIVVIGGAVFGVHAGNRGVEIGFLGKVHPLYGSVNLLKGFPADGDVGRNALGGGSRR